VCRAGTTGSTVLLGCLAVQPNFGGVINERQKACCVIQRLSSAMCTEAGSHVRNVTAKIARCICGILSLQQF
jgi:hypothetical protein